MKKRLLGMLLCCIMMIGMLPVSAAAASEERTCTLTADDSNAACGWLTGKIEVSTIDTVPFMAGRKILCKRFSTKSRMALESKADSGLNPLITESHAGLTAVAY